MLTLRHVPVLLAALAGAALLGGDPAAASSYRQVATFTGPEGGNPQSAMVNVGGTLYGTAPFGGDSNKGTVFKLNPRSGKLSAVYSFAGGTTDGAQPVGALVNLGGTLYGTTFYGGTSQFGTVFRVTPSTSTKATLYSFGGGSDGANPIAGLTNVGGTLYGTTTQGGPANLGTVFKTTPSTGATSVVYAFRTNILGNPLLPQDGQMPYSGVVSLGGKLYGTTNLGGIGTVGTVYTLTPSNGNEIPLYSFRGGTSDGSIPQSGLTVVNGLLYGVTTQGGPSDFGVIYSVNPSTGVRRVLYAFSGSDGTNPSATLLNVGGTLYGAASGGGTFGQGTVFSFNIGTGTFTVLHAFEGGIDGAYPLGGLVNVGGTLYGTTAQGGTTSLGTVYAITP